MRRDARVPVVELARDEELAALMRSEPLQELIAEHADVIELVAVKSYVGNAIRRRDGTRVVRMNVALDAGDSEFVLVLCHEVAHHIAGVRRRHDETWRRACAELLRRAGGLGLLSDEEVAQGVDTVLHGAASIFRGWDGPGTGREWLSSEVLDRDRERLREQGIELGSLVTFRYRNRWWQGEVVQVNRKTVSVGEPGKGVALLRVPFGRIVQAKPPE